MKRKDSALLRLNREEQGQTLVLTALAMFVLLGFLALAIDIGTAYAERRNMQNAADAASVAGTRVIVLKDSRTLDADVQRAIDTYAELNHGAVDYTAKPPVYIDSNGNTISIIGAGGAIPTGARGVSVNTKMTFDTFFASLLGHPVLDVGAECASMAYPAEMPTVGQTPPATIGGLVPLTVPKSAVDNRDPLIVWGSHYGQHYGVGANFKGILDFNNGSGPGYEMGSACGNKTDCVVQWITYGFDGHVSAYDWINEFNGELGNNVRSPLQKRLYDQNLSDDGGSYGYLIVPVWDKEEFGNFHICSFAQIKMYAADVDSNQATGEYVSFVVPDGQISAAPWDPTGPKVIKMVRRTNLPTPLPTNTPAPTVTVTASWSPLP